MSEKKSIIGWWPINYHK